MLVKIDNVFCRLDYEDCKKDPCYIENLYFSFLIAQFPGKLKLHTNTCRNKVELDDRLCNTFLLWV